MTGTDERRVEDIAGRVAIKQEKECSRNFASAGELSNLRRLVYAVLLGIVLGGGGSYAMYDKIASRVTTIEADQRAMMRQQEKDTAKLDNLNDMLNRVLGGLK